MSQLALNWPSSLQTPEQQTEAIQKAFSDIQKAFNATSTSASVIAHLPTAVDSANHSTASATPIQIPGWNWTINSSGGLVIIDANFCLAFTVNNNTVARVNLVIDGKTVVSKTNWCSTVATESSPQIHYAAILGAGKHTISFTFNAPSGGGTAQINLTSGDTSEATIIEFPSNVQNLNVASN
jgi:hypothetical protein